MGGGPGPTEIEKLAFEAHSLRGKQAHGEKWKAEAIARLKVRFAEALFPALMLDSTEECHKIVEAMNASRRYGGLIEYVLIRNKITPKKRAMLKLRCALLNLPKESSKSLYEVKLFLEKSRVDFCDDSSVCAVMRELGLRVVK